MLQDIHSEPRNKDTLRNGLKNLGDYLRKILGIEGTDQFQRDFVTKIIGSFNTGKFLNDFTHPNNWGMV